MNFKDLTEEAKEVVRAQNTRCIDYEWWDCTEDDFKENGKERGFDISDMYWSGFGSQGDGACWTGGINTLKFLCYHLKPEHPQFAQYQVLLELIAQGWVDSGVSVGTSGRYSHKYTMDIGTPTFGADESEQLLAGMLMGANVCDLYEAIGHDAALDALQVWMQDEAREYAGAYYEALEKEYDWLCSDEAIIDHDEDYEEDSELSEDGGILDAPVHC